jgi:hypothetical protein
MRFLQKIPEWNKLIEIVEISLGKSVGMLGELVILRHLKTPFQFKFCACILSS